MKMNKEEFLDLIAETLDVEYIEESMLLDEIDEYDSIAILGLMSMYDDIGVKVKPSDFENLKTVKDLIKLAGDKIE